MTVLDEDEELGAAQELPRPETSGRERMTRNVLWSWGGYLVYVVAGFVMPRLIDHHVGQAALGVWDFGWSFVSYFGLAHIGVGSSVNRYVAQHRALSDVAALNRTISSVTCVNLAAAFIVLLLTAGSTWAVPVLFSQRLGLHTQTAQAVVALLGISLAVQMGFDAYRGVVTGCHRWDLHNAVNSGAYALIVLVMVVVLAMGGGLPGLAVATLAGTFAGEFVRWSVARRVCPELRIRLANAEWGQARLMLAFGVKSSTGALARLLLIQANSLLVAWHLGPAVLAVYARPGALVRHVETFASKFAMVFTPTASSLQGSGRQAELRDLLLHGTRYAACLGLPLILTLAILGDPILRLWMGPRYEQGLVLAILAGGRLLPIVQQPVGAILMGLNLHGRVAIAGLVAAVCGVGLAVLTIGVLRWELVGAALAVAVPLTFGNGLFIPAYACRQLRIPLSQYYRQALLGPLACAVPFALCLAVSRILLVHRPLWAVISGLVSGAAVLLPLYWRYMLPHRVRERMAGLAARVFGRPKAVRT